MVRSVKPEQLTGISSRLGAFVAERYPFALDEALKAFDAIAGTNASRDEAGIDALRPAFRRELPRRLSARSVPQGLGETTPRTTVASRVERANTELAEACDGLFRRVAIEASLTAE